VSCLAERVERDGLSAAYGCGMTKLDVVAVLKAKPGSEKVVGSALAGLAASSRTDTGCIAYDVFVTEAEPGTFVTIEQWESQADLDAHMASPHLAETFAEAGSLLADTPSIYTLRRLDTQDG
jgi:quinol monooxygenase YgiN